MKQITAPSNPTPHFFAQEVEEHGQRFWRIFVSYEAIGGSTLAVCRAIDSATAIGTAMALNEVNRPAQK